MLVDGALIAIPESGFGHDSGEFSYKNVLLSRRNEGTISEEDDAYLTGMLRFPDNQMAAMLAKKQILDGISPEEEIQLQAYSAFPDDFVAANLMKKRLMGEATKEENTQFLNISKRQGLSPETVGWLDAVDNGCENTILTSMNQAREVEIKPGDDTKIAFTHGLGGCLSTVTVADLEDGRRLALQTHFDPTNTRQHTSEIENWVDRHPELTADDTQVTSMFLAPDDDFLKGNVDPIRELVEITLKSRLSESTFQFKQVEYPLNLDESNLDNGYFGVRIPPTSAETPPTYKTWFQSGTFSE